MFVFLKKSLKKHRAKIFAGFGVLLIACLFLAPLKPVQAETWSEKDAPAIVGMAMYGSLFVTSSLVKGCTYLAGMLLDAAISVDAGFAKAPVVELGWGITRSMVNMIFALILLIIAFGTILNIEPYGLKRLLPKLIITIFLINFSLFFAGVIIDFSNVLTGFFIQDGTNLSDSLMRSLNYGKQEDPGLLESVWNKAVGTAKLAWLSITGVPISLLIQLFFEVVLGSITTIVFFILALLFLVRIIALWILLILAPIAWALGVLPPTSSFFSKWWSSFLSWAFLAPIASFFIYLALSISKVGGKLIELSVLDQKNVQDFAGGFFTGLSVMEYIAVTGLLIASFTVGKSMSGQIGKMTLDLANEGRKILGNQALKLGQTQVKEGDGKATRALKTTGQILAKPFGYGLRYDLVGAGIKKGMGRTAEPIERRAGSDVYDMTTGLLSLGKIKTNEGGRAAQNEAVRRQKEIQTFSSNSEYYKQRLKAATDAGDLDASLRLLAAAENPEVLMKTLMDIPEVKEKLGFTGSELSPEHLMSAIHTAYALKGVPRQDINKNLADISKTFDKNKYAAYTNMGSWDGNAGGPIMKFDGTQNIYTGWDSKGQEIKYNEDEINAIAGKSKETRSEDENKKYEIHMKGVNNFKKHIDSNGVSKVLQNVDPSTVFGVDGKGEKFVTATGEMLLKEIGPGIIAKMKEDIAANRKPGIGISLARAIISEEGQKAIEKKFGAKEAPMAASKGMPGAATSVSSPGLGKAWADYNKSKAPKPDKDLGAVVERISEIQGLLKDAEVKKLLGDTSESEVKKAAAAEETTE